MKACECGKPAEFLCDGRLGRGYVTATCDAPLCSECRTNAGTFAACSRGKGCEVGSVDYCKRCLTKERLGVS